MTIELDPTDAVVDTPQTIEGTVVEVNDE